MNALANIADLGSQVAIVLIFLWYMRSRNGKMERVLTRIYEAQEEHTKVLRKVAQNRGVDSDKV